MTLLSFHSELKGILATARRSGVQSARSGAAYIVLSAVVGVVLMPSTPSGYPQAPGVQTGNKAATPELVLQTGHTKSVAGVAFSPDSRLLASASLDNTIKIWSVTTGRELRTLAGHAGAVKAVAFSPDGKLLASGSNDKTVRIWNTTTGQEMLSLTGHSGPVSAVAFSADSRRLASGSVDKTAILWDAASGSKQTILSGHEGSVTSIAFSPNGSLLASGSSDAMIKLWETTTGHEQRTLKGHADKIRAVVFSFDGQWLASASNDSTVKLWRLSSKPESFTLLHSSKVLSVFFRPNGQLASGSENDAIILWDLSTRQKTRSFGGPNDSDTAAESIAFSPNGQISATGSGDKTVTLRDLGTGRMLRRLESRSNGIFASAFSPGGRWLAEGGYDNTVRLWDITTGRELPALVGHTGYITAIAFTSDDRWLCSASMDGNVKVWDPAFGVELQTLKGGLGAVTAIALSHDGKLLASGGQDKTIKLWNLATGQEARTLTGHQDEVTTLSFSPDSQTLASGSLDKTVHFWDPATGSERGAPMSRHAGVNASGFSADGRWLALGNADSTVSLIEANTWREASTLSGHSREVTAVCFSLDSLLLASAGNDRTVKIWSVSSGKEIRTLSGHAGIVNAVSFSGDGRWLASGSEDGSTMIWDTKTGQPTAILTSLRHGDDWLVVTPGGLFDGSPAAWGQILWRFAHDTQNVAPVEAFFNEFFYPGLLADILAGKKLAVQDISQKDRRQPELQISVASALATGNVVSEPEVKVRIEVAEAGPDGEHSSGSGVRDLRLFRNGSLVRVWRGDLSLDRNKKTIVDATIPAIAGENQLTAYAFNRDNVKSVDARLSLTGAESLRRPGTLYVISVGVNEYDNSGFNLRYAVPDAVDFGEEIVRQQKAIGRFEKLENIALFDGMANRSNILLALKRLSGASKGILPQGAPAVLERVHVSQPEDTVVLYFAGHGTAGPSAPAGPSRPQSQRNHNDRFYLIPFDLGYAGPVPDEPNDQVLRSIIERGISDEDLEHAFENIDAAHIVIVIDACESGQALDSAESRRGPMNSRGLAQLAYEKGMYILTAAQSSQEALADKEVAKGHGYLTYALVDEGLKTGAADRSPKDGIILLREWLDYASQRVPQMQEEKRQTEKVKRAQEIKAELQTSAGGNRGLEVRRLRQNRLDSGVQRPRVFYRPEQESRPLIIARVAYK